MCIGGEGKVDMLREKSRKRQKRGCVKVGMISGIIIKLKLRKRRLKKSEVFGWLNDEFETKHLGVAIEMFNLKNATIWNYLKEECSLGYIESETRGLYEKV